MNCHLVSNSDVNSTQIYSVTTLIHTYLVSVGPTQAYHNCASVRHSKELFNTRDVVISSVTPGPLCIFMPTALVNMVVESYFYIFLEPDVPPPRPLPPGKSATCEQFAYIPTHSFQLQFTRFQSSFVQ